MNKGARGLRLSLGATKVRAKSPAWDALKIRDLAKTTAPQTNTQHTAVEYGTHTPIEGMVIADDLISMVTNPELSEVRGKILCASCAAIAIA